jgi:hypothetical protein
MSSSSFPAIFWDLYGKKGHRVSTAIAEMGPLLLERLTDASDAQEGVPNIKIADQGGLMGDAEREQGHRRLAVLMTQRLRRRRDDGIRAPATPFGPRSAHDTH